MKAIASFVRSKDVSLYLIKHIIANTLPDITLGIQHQGNWPNDAEWGVEYQFIDKQFPNVEQVVGRSYFTSKMDFLAWIEMQKEFVKSTDNDFSVTFSAYEWDLGPNFIYKDTI